MAAGLLAAGIAAWAIVLAAVAVLQDDTDAIPTSTPEVIAQRPTLAAQTPTPLPTATRTPTRTPSPVPTIAPTSTATATTVPAVTSPPAGTVSAPETMATAADEAVTVGVAATADTATDAEMPPDAAVPDTFDPHPAADDIEPLATAPSKPTLAPTDTGDEPQSCAPPEGWEPYVVQPDDTLFAFVLGAEEVLTVDELMAANCLSSRFLRVNQVIYLPPGAADNAPPSAPYVSPDVAQATGPREPACPCTITVALGWRREQIADAISSAQTRFMGGDFLAATGPGASAPFDFVMERPAGTSMEGFLFPGTYTLQNDTTAEQFRDMLLSAFAANVSPQMRADAAAHGLSFYQVLILASIVQREVRGPETQKIVASIYHNRVRSGWELGTTVSVQYALGGPGNWWPRVLASDLKVNSPYNTYSRPGLPPTPVDSPGLDAIAAAVYPAQTNYYFHTASCNGTGEVFAETFEEHLANVNCEN